MPLFDLAEGVLERPQPAHATLRTGGVSPDTNDRSAAASERLTTADVQEVKNKSSAAAMADEVSGGATMRAAAMRAAAMRSVGDDGSGSDDVRSSA